MPLFQWTPELSVNVKEIDNQHKKLVNLINLLHDSMKSGKGKAVMGKVLNDLTDYTVYHFGTEERLFQKYGYIEYPQHKQEHDDLTKQVLDVRSKFEAGQTTITIEVMNFLKDWLNNHIKYSDKKYSAFLNSKGVN
ncbi:MAG: hemerythrin [Ignavibacteriae bacterium 37-53-5]|nr:MAG: hemerythrin [Ignavibacteriae bacterium 37-53-5]